MMAEYDVQLVQVSKQATALAQLEILKDREGSLKTHFFRAYIYVFQPPKIKSQNRFYMLHNF